MNNFLQTTGAIVWVVFITGALLVVLYNIWCWFIEKRVRAESFTLSYHHEEVLKALGWINVSDKEATKL
jgi:hypothetical protein